MFNDWKVFDGIDKDFGGSGKLDKKFNSVVHIPSAVQMFRRKKTPFTLQHLRRV